MTINLQEEQFRTERAIAYKSSYLVQLSSFLYGVACELIRYAISFPENACSRVITRKQAYSGNEIGRYVTFHLHQYTIF
jgi:hypothetical protein